MFGQFKSAFVALGIRNNQIRFGNVIANLRAVLSPNFLWFTIIKPVTHPKVFSPPNLRHVVLVLLIGIRTTAYHHVVVSEN